MPSNSVLRHDKYFVERQISHLGHEVGVIINSAGQEVCRVNGETSEVGFTLAQLAQAKDGIVTHNHPSGGYFSPEDVKFAHENNVAELRVVRRKSSRMGEGEVLVLHRPLAGWLPVSVCNYLEAIGKNQLLKDCNVVGIDEALWTDEQHYKVAHGLTQLGLFLVQQLGLLTETHSLHDPTKFNHTPK